MRRVILVLIGMLGLNGCDLGRRIADGGGGKGSFRTEKAQEQRATVGRFSLLQGSTRLPSGKEVPVIVRMDSATGETWFLATDPNRWMRIEDDLQRVERYNAQGQKIGSGVKVPDGRDLNELSKEELIRHLAAAIRNGQSPDPKDPLGIRNKDKPK